jgi:hypothetical protein
MVIQKYKISIECGANISTMYSTTIARERMVSKYLKELFEDADKTRRTSKAPRVKIRAGIPKASANSTQALRVQAC